MTHPLDDSDNVPADWTSWALYRNGEWTAHVRLDPPGQKATWQRGRADAPSEDATECGGETVTREAVETRLR